jgi:hypothetical protein
MATAYHKVLGAQRILPFLVRFWRSPVVLLSGFIRLGFLQALRFLLLIVLLPHGVPDRLKAFVRRGVVFGKAFTYSLPQLVEREFGIWILLCHNQETRSDLASSKQRPIFILTLS